MYKEFVINGEIVNKWVDVTKVRYSYSEEGKNVYEYTSDGVVKIFKYDLKNRLIESFRSDEDCHILIIYDSNDNIIYTRDPWEGEQWFDYDTNNVLRKYQNSYGDETLFDKNGIVLIEKEHGIETKKILSDSTKFNKHYICTNNKITWEEREEYNEDFKITHSIDSDGFEIFYSYDDNGNCIHEKRSNGYEIWYQFDDNNNKIYLKENDEKECVWKYDENNNEIYSNYGYETWTEYNFLGKEIHKKSTSGFESWKEYDKDGRVIFEYSNKGLQRWYEYELTDDNRIFLIHIYECK